MRIFDWLMVVLFASGIYVQEARSDPGYTYEAMIEVCAESESCLHLSTNKTINQDDKYLACSLIRNEVEEMAADRGLAVTKFICFPKE